MEREEIPKLVLFGSTSSRGRDNVQRLKKAAESCWCCFESEASLNICHVLIKDGDLNKGVWKSSKCLSSLRILVVLLPNGHSRLSYRLLRTSLVLCPTISHLSAFPKIMASPLLLCLTLQDFFSVLFFTLGKTFPS